MSGNSQFSLLQSTVMRQATEIQGLKNDIEAMKNANITGALESIEKQQKHAQLVAANPQSTVEELQQALPLLTSTAYQEQARYAIRVKQQEQASNEMLQALPNLWQSERVQNMQRDYGSGDYQLWQAAMKQLEVAPKSNGKSRRPKKAKPSQAHQSAAKRLYQQQEEERAKRRFGKGL